MFDNIGSKVKTMATVICVLGMIASVILGIITIIGGQFLIGLLTTVIGAFISWLSCLALYAIGESAENTEIIFQKIKTIENKLEKIASTHTTPSPEDKNAPNIPSVPKPDPSINAKYASGSWTCLCGAKNPSSARTCSVCFKSRPTQK